MKRFVLNKTATEKLELILRPQSLWKFNCSYFRSGMSFNFFPHCNLNPVQTVLQFSTGLSFPPSCKDPYNVNGKRLTIIGFRVNISIKVRNPRLLGTAVGETGENHRF